MNPSKIIEFSTIASFLFLLWKGKLGISLWIATVKYPYQLEYLARYGLALHRGVLLFCLHKI